MTNKGLSAHDKALFSHRIRIATDADGISEINEDYLNEHIEGKRLPSPVDQQRLLLGYPGDSIESPNELATHSRFVEATPRIGAIDLEGTYYIAEQLVDQGYLKANDSTNLRFGCTLTMKGWEFHQQIKLAHAVSTTAFMALDFSNTQLAIIINEGLKPACLNIGYDLETVRDNQSSGLIDLHIENDIKNAAFVVVDITDNNSGAYWEAGFAEALGKCVIYMCKESVFHSKNKEDWPHFDIAHRLHVLWDKDNPKQAGVELAETVTASILAGKIRMPKSK